MQVPVGLEAHPELRRCLEEAREPERRIPRNAALAEYDFVHPIERDVESASVIDLTIMRRAHAYESA
jgi:hypothetical protein